MREILFKAKKICGGSWVTGCYYTDGKVHYMLITHEGDYVDVDIEIDPNTLCEYTGLEDKYGNKIFEHDIVEFTKHNDFGVLKYEVVFEKGQFKAKNYQSRSFKRTLTNKNIIKVLGNKFDNPELYRNYINFTEGSSK